MDGGVNSLHAALNRQKVVGIEKISQWSNKENVLNGLNEAAANHQTKLYDSM